MDLSNLLIQYGTIFGFIAGVIIGAIIGWIARGFYHTKKNAGATHADVLAVLTSILVISLWAMAHINNIFFGGADVNWILNVIGGLAVSSLLQEKDSFIKIVTAIRGGGDKK